MNASIATNVRKAFVVIGVATALLAGASSAFAANHGGGFGGGFHGGGAHFAGGRFGASAGHAGVHLAARGGYRLGGAYGLRGGAYGLRGGAYGVRGGYGYGYHAGWAGGYWRGAWWPRAWYGWSYPYFLGVLPALYATYWWDGVPYYYVNNVYYTWDTADNGYVVTDPPPVNDGANDAAADAVPPDAAAGAAPAPAPEQGIIAYPRNGQTDQQQASDKYACHSWARSQSGFDPTSQASSGASPDARSAYSRAMAACMDAKGYTVR